MEYIISFLEGIATFISPCLLPMLPIYISYFAGQNKKETKNTIKNAFGFVLGFSSIFVLLGVLAGTFGKFVKQYMSILNIIFGILVIAFGINFIGIIKIPFLNKTRKIPFKAKDMGFLSSFLFGIIFSIGWTPCVGAFLGSALLMVTTGGQILKGGLLLLCFSIGLGIPFIISAILVNRLKTTIDLIKKHYIIINTISGLFLILIGILMATGILGNILRGLANY